jgi:hypothetical protein
MGRWIFACVLLALRVSVSDALDRPPENDDSVIDDENDDGMIKVGVILPFSNNFPWGIPKTGPGISLAVETVNKWTLLGGRQLHLELRDSRCSDTYGPLAAIDMYHTKNVHVFLGPACDYAVAPVARFSPYWNIPVITAGAPVMAFSDKASQYKLLTRIGFTYAKLGEFFGKMFEQFDWLVMGMIFQNNRDSTKGRSDCYFAMDAVYDTVRKRYNAKFPQGEEFWYQYIDEGADPPDNITKILLKGSEKSRGNVTFSISHPTSPQG